MSRENMAQDHCYQGLIRHCWHAYLLGQVFSERFGSECLCLMKL